MYTIDQIKELIQAVDKSTISSLEIDGEKGEKIAIKREFTVTAAPQSSVAAPQVVQTIDTTAKIQTENLVNDTVVKGTPVSSPMVGVFYASPSPDSDPYVTVGSAVKKGDTICIIEAMKLMNEITAEKSGTIAEICVNSGDIVEYGQTLFIIE